MRRLARSKLPAAVLGAALALTGAACDDNGDEGSRRPDEGVDVEDLAQAGTIAEDEFGIYDADELGALNEPSLVGRTVVVSAEINRMIEEDAAFVIGEDVVDGGLLVVTPPRLEDEPVLTEGAVVQVVGRVVEFNVVDIETDYDPFDLDDELYVDWEDRIVLVAQAVSFAPPEGADQGAEGATLAPSTIPERPAPPPSRSTTAASR